MAGYLKHVLKTWRPYSRMRGLKDNNGNTILRKISKLGFDTEPGGFGYSLKKTRRSF